MFEILFRKLFGDYRNQCAEIVYRLEKRMDRNEKMETFLMHSAVRFRKDPRAAVRFVWYMGIAFGHLLAKENTAEIEDLFNVTSLSPETEKRLEDVQ